MTPEEAFCRAWGREPSRAERERLRRLQTAFEIDENDALLTIAMVLEFYDGHFRVYPSKCADAASFGVKRWLESPEGVAAIQRALAAPSSASARSSSPALTGASPDMLSSEARRELYWVTLGGLATASSALCGAFGMVVGARLSGQHPCWVAPSAASSVIANLVGAPTGWVVFLALFVPAYYAARWGWQQGCDRQRAQRERWLGWVALVAVAASVLGWVMLISRLALQR